jgi:hypothetical protein
VGPGQIGMVVAPDVPRVLGECRSDGQRRRGDPCNRQPGDDQG